MINSNFVILGALISFIGTLSYLRDTLKGKTKPDKVTWFIWVLAPMVAFGAELNKGVGIQSLMTFMVGFNPLLIFLASFINKKSQWKIGKLDITCGFLSILGLMLWIVYREGNYAIILAILADTMAAIPTLIKSYKYPETENYFAFLGGAVSALLTTLTIRVWDFAHFGFPIYTLLLCSLFVFLIKFKLGKKLGYN